MQPVIGAELAVIDKAMVAIAGTGPFAINVGTRRPSDSYVELSLKSGKRIAIESAGETARCKQCEMRSACPYTSVIFSPLKHRNSIVGIFGILGYDRCQQEMMQQKSMSLSYLLENIGDFIMNRFLKYNTEEAGFINSREMGCFVEDIDKGLVVTDSVNRKTVQSQNVYKYHQRSTSPSLIGSSKPILKLKDIVSKIAVNDSRVLIRGETGTGKELVAQLVHHHSERSHDPFVALNCGALPETLIESELFGYSKGAFTDARKNGKTGKFEQANGGTIFLDEIGNLPLTGQAKILRILDNGILERVGGESSIKLDVRVVCATNKDLVEMVAKGQFMEDLYYRLNVVQVEVPPLRERKSDIPLLLGYYITEHNHRFGSHLKGFSNEALSYLIHFQWPGNIRELKNVTEYVCNIKTNGLATLEDLPPYMSPLESSEGIADPEPIDTQALMIEEAMRLFGDSTTGKQNAAKYLGISVSTLYRKLSSRQSVKKASSEHLVLKHATSGMTA